MFCSWEKERENLSHLSDDVTSTTGSASGKRLSGSGRRSFFKVFKISSSSYTLEDVLAKKLKIPELSNIFETAVLQISKVKSNLKSKSDLILGI